MGVFVRGLWGDQTLKRRNYDIPDAFSDVLHNAKDAVQHYTDVVYCFGESNREYLKRVGFADVRMIDSRPWAGTWRNEQPSSGSGALRYGESYWWHKIWIWEAALQDFGEIVWLDMRCENLEPITDEYWQRRRRGADFQAALYMQRNFSWGAAWRYDRWSIPGAPRTKDKEAAKTVPGCGCIYLRGDKFIQECLQVYDFGYRFLDHMVCAAALDRRHNGWLGIEEYVKQGYWLDDYCYGRNVLEPNRRTWHVRKRPSNPPRR